MNWFRRQVGLDWLDVLIQFGVTVAVMSFFGMEGDEQMIPVVVAASFVVLGVRRHFALRRVGGEPEGVTTGQMAAARLEEMEQRLADLEAAQARVLELEERLDFTERLLVQGTGERVRVPAEAPRDG
jgi:hypothetical protein